MKWLSFFLSAAICSAGPVLDIIDKKGNTLNAEVISMTEKAVSVKRTSDKKFFKIPLANLNEATIKMLKEKTKDLPAALPDYEIDFSVGKRRKKDGTYYVNMTISGKATITNISRDIDSPEVNVNIIITGEDQVNEDLKCILSNQSFTVSPGKMDESEVQIKEFVTRYDSDNAGEGNWGGYKYGDYIVLITDKNGDYVASKTLNNSYEDILAGNNVMAKKLRGISKDAKFVGDLSFGDE